MITMLASTQEMVHHPVVEAPTLGCKAQTRGRVQHGEAGSRELAQVCSSVRRNSRRLRRYLRCLLGRRSLSDLSSNQLLEHLLSQLHRPLPHLNVWHLTMNCQMPRTMGVRELVKVNRPQPALNLRHLWCLCSGGLGQLASVNRCLSMSFRATPCPSLPVTRHLRGRPQVS